MRRANLHRPPGLFVSLRRRDTLSMSLAVALLLCLLFTLLPHEQAAAANSVQMLVRAGFDGAGKVGGWLPVDIDIRNDGDDIEGEIQIVVQDTATNRGTY